MRKRLDRHLTLDQLKEEAESFLRETYADVRGIGITSIATNVRNPQRDTWGTWGTRMVKVWGNAEVKERELDLHELDSLEPENFEIEEVIKTDREDGDAEQDSLEAGGSGSVPSEVYDSGYLIETEEGSPEEWLDSLDSHRPVSFQLEIYVNRNGKDIGHRGVLSDKDAGLVPSGGGSLSIEQLKARARGFLKEKFRSVRGVRIRTLKEATLHGAFVYDVFGDAAASENEVVPPVIVFFNFRIYIKRDGSVTLSRARMWER